jgi:phosphoglycerate dehydrogenase-like enzyme
MTPRTSPGHRDPLAEAARPIEHRPEAGPIAILPAPTATFTEAIAAAGGEVAPLSAATRGLVWLNIAPDGLGELLDEHPGIGWVQLPLAGIDRYAHVLAAHPNRVWTSAKGLYAEPVAEQALALTLAVLRWLPEKSRSSSWATEYTGISLYGRSVLIVGAGGIALELIRLLEPFEVRVTIVRRTPDPVPGAERTVTTAQLGEVLPDADVLILAAAATAETRGLIGAKELAAMKPQAAFINIARGPLVDSDALAAALTRGHLSGAGLDVTDPEPLPDGHPLWSAPRVVITSHSADTPDMVKPLLAERARVNTAAFLGDGAFVGIVDPAVGY